MTISKTEKAIQNNNLELLRNITEQNNSIENNNLQENNEQKIVAYTVDDLEPTVKDDFIRMIKPDQAEGLKRWNEQGIKPTKRWCDNYEQALIAKNMNKNNELIYSDIMSEQNNSIENNNLQENNEQKIVT